MLKVEENYRKTAREIEYPGWVYAVVNSLKNKLRDLQSNQTRLPYEVSDLDDKYSMMIHKEYYAISGYNADLRINKIYYNMTTYMITEPLVIKDFRILGIFDKSGNFSCYSTYPLFGFHYMYGSPCTYYLCLGKEVVYPTPVNLSILKDNCKRIHKSLETINTRSLGTIIVPDEYDKWMSVGRELGENEILDDIDLTKPLEL